MRAQLRVCLRMYVYSSCLEQNIIYLSQYLISKFDLFKRRRGNVMIFCGYKYIVNCLEIRYVNFFSRLRPTEVECDHTPSSRM